MIPFRVAYVDPPWEFRNKKTGGSHTSGAAQKYPVLDVDAICALPVQSIMDADSVLALWVPTSINPAVPSRVLQAWGYRYKTKAYWHKTGALGLGFYFRNQIEELWFAVKGDVAPFGLQVRNVSMSGREGHSAKPWWFRDLVEHATAPLLVQDEVAHVELFARPFIGAIPWEKVGKEIDGKDIRTALRDLSRRLRRDE